MRADYMPNVVDDFQTFIGWQHQAISHIYIYCWCYHLVWLLRNCQERNFGTTAATSMSVAAVTLWRRQRYEKVEEIKKQLETKKEDQHGPTVVLNVLSCNRINEWLVQGSIHFLNGHVFSDWAMTSPKVGSLLVRCIVSPCKIYATPRL